MTGSGSGPVVPPWCEHAAGGHDDGAPSAATAPAGARAWLLIESAGPWASEATATALPAPLAKLAIGADEQGIRVQLIRRPGRSGNGRPGNGRPGNGGAGNGRSGNGGAAGRDGVVAPAVFAGWTAGPAPWLRRTSADSLDPDVLAALAAGEPPPGTARDRPLFLVCTHARRDRCCGRFGVPLARDLATRYPEEVWETTHVGGHRFAANLVILPHGLYYGPVDVPAARAAIDAYQRGTIIARGYRGRAGQQPAAQEADRAALTGSGTLAVDA